MRIAPVLGVLALAASSAAADVVHLKGGGRLVGRVEEDGTSVRVVMAGGTMTLPRERVESIERQETPASQFARRRAALVEGDVRAARELAAFAGEAGLAAERGEVLALAAGWAPSDTALRAELGLWRVFDRELPPNPGAETALAACMGEGAKVYRTPHWRIAYATDAAIARRRGELLEAAWRKFRALAERTGAACHPLEDRMECVVYADHAQWLPATGLAAESVDGLSGIYIGTTRRILLYDTRTSPAARRSDLAVDTELAALAGARDALAAQRGEVSAAEQALADGAARHESDARVAELRRDLADAKTAIDADRRELAEREGALERYRDEAARHFEAENVSSTTHEACHQIAFALGVSRPGQPLWLVEGLATLFEAQSRTNFVLAAPNEGRLKDARAAWTRGEGGRLADVVTDGVFADRARGSNAYAESWTLAYFLVNRHAGEFARYLAEGAIAAATPEARLADFRRFFGDDLGALEREWHGYIGRL